MIRALFSSATGMRAQETNIDVISNNLANINTTSYKRSRAEFQDLMYQQVLEPGAPTSATTSSPTGIQIGLGVRTSGVQKIFSQGDLISTTNQLDLAIEGSGFFQVTLPDGGTSYTRSGSFRLGEDGSIVTSDGYEVDPGITIPPEALNIAISQDGNVSYTTSTTSTPTIAGQLTAVRFPNDAGLRAIGRNLYQETSASGTPTTGVFSESGFGRLQQGFLESSNVSVVEQVVSMITAQRAYEASSKGISTAEEMVSAAINLKR